MPYIAIDTNIFEHLLNRAEKNPDDHIDRLLGKLRHLDYQLLVDSTKKIGNEYQIVIVPIIRRTDDTGLKLQLLRYWMQPDIREEVTLVSRDNLMQQIQTVIYEPSEHADRAFVYVVCRQNSTLITNDNMHILGRRAELLRRTRRERGPGSETDIQTSVDAHATFCGNGEEA